jgi:hypothetical protein
MSKVEKEEESVASPRICIQEKPLDEITRNSLAAVGIVTPASFFP